MVRLQSGMLIVDLCDDSSPEQTQPSINLRNAEQHADRFKRPREEQQQTWHEVINLADSDEEDSDIGFALRSPIAENRRRARPRHVDDLLASQLQQEEQQSSLSLFHPPSRHPGSSGVPFYFAGHSAPTPSFDGRGDIFSNGSLGTHFRAGGTSSTLGSHAHAGLNALFSGGYHVMGDGGSGVYGGGGRGGRGRGGNFLGGYAPWALHMPDAGLYPQLVGGRASGGARGRQGQHLAHLSFLDRDFDEADYEMLLQLDEEVGPEKKKMLKANAKRLEQLGSHKLSKHQVKPDDICVICLEALKPQQAVLDMPCKHDFHKACIIKWLKQNESPSCPICKQPVLQEPEHKHKGEPLGNDVSSPPELWWHT